MKVLVTDGDFKHSLAIVRALGTKGVEVHAASTTKHAVCFYSKFTRKSYVLPPPILRREFVHELERIDRRENYDAILPVGNESWFAVMTLNSERLSRKIAKPDPNSYLVACNKAKTLSLAQELNIPIPETLFPSDCLNRRKVLNARYPLVLKPSLGSGNTQLIYSPEEVMQYGRYASEEDAFVIQEFVHGEGYGFFALYKKGRIVASFMHKRIREVPSGGGPSSAARSVYDEKILGLGTRILDHLSWHGVAMVEFRKDSRTGDFRLLEINPKFWGSLDLAIESGINFPYLAASMVAFNDVAPPSPYQRNLKYCWPIPDDVQHLLGRPASAFALLRDWTDSSVGKNIWKDDLAPHSIQLAKMIAGATFPRLHTLRTKISQRPERFSWALPGLLAASARPRSKMQFVWLKRHNLKTIVNLTNETPSSRWLRSFEGLCFEIPMGDHIPPSTRRLTEAVELILEQLSKNRPVVVHCLGGLGRTGTVLACYIVRTRCVTPETAIDEVRKQRPGSIELPQEQSVREYHATLEWLTRDC